MPLAPPTTMAPSPAEVSRTFNDALTQDGRQCFFCRMRFRKRALLAVLTGVLTGIFALAPPALANPHPGPRHPDSGTLTWFHPGHR
ncbi:hypothetical protein Atai01_03410 [Amycolatopsis taiwanensis]|uniref:Uncharacterized protein n=2 Tax=Amycolatopsis taiwanensis TaxID=342230 RepID=A0A9W6QX88_9PSEU|nr:hypothetical protein Atai01_03410 [Amycolatopsis taiwanensis]